MSIKFYSGLKNGYQDFSNFAKAPFTIPELDVEDSVEPEDIFISIDGSEATEESIADWAETLSDSERFNKLLLFEKAYNALFDAVEEAGSTIYKPYQKDIDAWEKEIEDYYDAYYGQFRNA